jgi:hypothetical protein
MLATLLLVGKVRVGPYNGITTQIMEHCANLHYVPLHLILIPTLAVKIVLNF